MLVWDDRHALVHFHAWISTGYTESRQPGQGQRKKIVQSNSKKTLKQTRDKTSKKTETKQEKQQNKLATKQTNKKEQQTSNMYSTQKEAKIGKKIAKKGKKKYMKYFNSTIVAEYIINNTFSLGYKKNIKMYRTLSKQ